MNISTVSSDQGLKYIPLLTPAINADRFNENFFLIEKRAWCITAVALSILLATAIVNTTRNLDLGLWTFTPVLLLLTTFLDVFWAEKAANMLAIDNYLFKEKPSVYATFRIQKKLNAAKELVKNGADLNKVNKHGDRLLDNIHDFAVFKFLLDSGANLKLADRHGKTYFQRFIEEDNPHYLKYILVNKFVSKDSFNSDVLTSIENCPKTHRARKLLSKHFFDS